MKYSSSISTIFDTHLERAFKTPMLCDIRQVHTGYLMTPKVTHCTEDETWGREGGSRIVHAAKNIFFPKGLVSLDSVVERKENVYWKIQITNFSQWILGIHTFEGEWFTKPISSEKTTVIYSYTLHSKLGILFPFHYVFTKIIWRLYMKHVLENVRKLAMNEAPYLHN